MEDFQATIREDSPRAADWIKVFGSREVTLQSPFPQMAKLPSGRRLVYQLDLKALDSEQRARLVAHIAERFHLPVESVDTDLESIGCSILGEDVTVIVSHPQ
jgi:hypothetical protein